MELLSFDQKELIIKNESRYIVLNLHRSSSRGPFITFSFTNYAEQYQATEDRAILPLSAVATQLRDAMQTESHIKLYNEIKRKLAIK